MNWLESSERAIENAEGQVALARALDLGRIEINAEDLAKILGELKSQFAVIEAAIKWRERDSQINNSIISPQEVTDLRNSVDALIQSREK